MIGRRPMIAQEAVGAPERTLALLGLARKAGRLAVGATAVAKLVRQGANPVVVLAGDAGAGLKRRVLRMRPVRGFVIGLVNRRDLAERLGRGDLAVVAVTDRGFVRGLIEIGVVEAGSEDRAAASNRHDDGRR